MPCEYCDDTGMLDVLDVWEVQRMHLKYGVVSIDSHEALPFIKQAVKCYKCHGDKAFDEDMKKLTKKMGGNPFNAETFK
ncbi:hypothetical protein LCGC14_3028290 [marine sediment metagenome]|uniref:Uncharacterized protein n=1 Tax=marine sediment metagenome TaxID=412755 RepID=A0A0F8WT11_9ZZZZ